MGRQKVSLGLYGLQKKKLYAANKQNKCLAKTLEANALYHKEAYWAFNFMGNILKSIGFNRDLT